MSLVTGSKDFIGDIKEKLNQLAGVTEQKIREHKTANAYTLRYHSKNDFLKLFNFFYDKYTIDNKLYLTRKYNLFKEWREKSIL